jgi:transcriptional antiterminator RfaH
MTLAGHAARWIIVNTHPHREHMALANLLRQNFTAYCPMIRQRRKHARRVAMVLRPLFPGYLFVRAEPQSTRWRPILSTYGVKTVVRAGEQLSYLENAFVASLRAREIDGAIVRPAHPYHVGDKVQIAAGPFDGIVSTIIELDERDRVVVLVELMNRGVKLRLQSTGVTPLRG